MAQTVWVGNAQTIAQVDTLTLLAVPGGGGGNFTAQVSDKSITYTTIAGDTTTTAAAAWQALLNSSQVPAEFKEISFTVLANVITATAKAPGTPFTLSSSGGSGAGLSQLHVTANGSPSDVSNPNNWLRNGAAHIPTTNDDVVLANSTVPLLWNLDFFASTVFHSFTRWQSFQARQGIGLPVVNANGYLEYRPTYFQFAGGSGTITIVTLGVGNTGNGPGRERYNVGSSPFAFNIFGSGQPLDTYAISLLATNTGNVIKMLGTSVALAMAPGETSGLALATVDGGGRLAVGSLVNYGPVAVFPMPSSSAAATNPGILHAIGATLEVFSAPGSLTVEQGSTAILGTLNQFYPMIAAYGGSLITCKNLIAVFTQLNLQGGSILDKSGDVLPLFITNAGIQNDCQVLDPNNCIVWTNPAVVQGSIQGGIFTTGTGRTVQII